MSTNIHPKIHHKSKIKLDIFKIVNSVTGLISDEHKTLKKISRIYDFLLLIFILSSLSSLWFPLNVIRDNKLLFTILDGAGATFLTIDLFLRFYVSEIKYKKFKHNKILFWIMPEVLIILFSIATSIGDLSFYYPDVTTYTVINNLKLIRILRLFLLFIYTEAFLVLYGAIKRAWKPLIMTFIFIIFLIFVASIIYYRIELSNPVNQVTQIDSYWESLYATIITVATIGYGDFVPSEAGSKILLSALAVIGIFSIAVPSAILASSFIVEFKQEDKRNEPRNKMIKKMNLYKDTYLEPFEQEKKWKK